MDVKIADRLNEAAVEPYLFLGFTQRGRSRARINGVNLAAREGNFRSVSRKMKGALREQHRRLRPRNDRDEYSGSPAWWDSGNRRHHCRIGVGMIMTWDEVQIGEPTWHSEREPRRCKRKELRR